MCLSPAVSGASSLAVEVSNNGVDFSTGGAALFQYGALSHSEDSFFTYSVCLRFTANPAVSSLSVTTGPEGTFSAVILFPVANHVCVSFWYAVGGTSVTVTGSGFVSTAAGGACSFGGAVTKAHTYVSATRVICLSPARAAGAAAVSVSNNGGADFGAAGAAFTYYGIFTSLLPVLVVYSLEACVVCFVAALFVTSLDPSFGSLGAATVFTVSGSGFYAAATCNASAATTVVSSTRMLCAAPVAASVGSFAVAIANNGLDYEQTGLSFQIMGMQHICILRLLTMLLAVALAAVPVVATATPTGGPLQAVPLSVSAERICVVVACCLSVRQQRGQRFI